MARIRKVIFEYIGTDQDMDRFLEAAVRDYYGNRLDVPGVEGNTFVGKAENPGDTGRPGFSDSY